jgi:hypothetical protein
MTLEERRVATERTLARFRSKVFDWRTGTTCVHLARTHLRNMGHRPATVPRIRSALAARRALKANGWQSVEDMLDSMLPRIAPAQRLLGDLAVVPGGEGMGSIMIALSATKLLGWHPETGAMVIYDGGVEDLTGCWRV